MTSEEVVVGDKEDGESDGAIEIVKPAAGAGVEFVGAIESFNDLLKLSVFGTFLVLVGQADDSASFNKQSKVLKQSGVIDGMHSGVIGRVAVGDELDGGIFRRSSDGFFQRDESVANISGIGEMIGVDSTGVGADGEPGVIPPIGHADIGFIAGDTRVDRSFVMHVKWMTKHGGGIGVVQDSLMGYRSLKDVLKHVSRHSRTESI